ncbi:MAG: hypothetical protein ACYS47_06830 [Planctomycetota bacterium]|jgi:hypothetical protein
MNASTSTIVSVVALILLFAAPSGTAVAAPPTGVPDLLLCLAAQGEEGWGWEGEDEETPKEEEADPAKEEGPGWGGGGDEWGEGPIDEGPPPEEEEIRSPELRGKGKKLSISLWALGDIPMSGDAGAGTGAPGWADAYGLGIGGGGTFALRLLPCLDVRLGGYYQSFPSKTFKAAGDIDNELSSFTLFGAALGARFFILTDRPTNQWFGQSLRPFLGAAFFVGFDFGIGFSSAVTWEEPAPAWDYWDGGMLIIQELVLGAEYRFAENVGAFLELGMPTISGPAAADGEAKNLGLNDAGSLSTLRVKVGMLFAF